MAPDAAPSGPLSLTSFLEGAAAARPAGPALLAGGSTVTFAALAEAARRTAGGLAALGVGPGDRIALWLPNVVAWPVLFFAAAQLGAVVVAVNTRFRAIEVADVVGRSRASVLVLWPAYRGIDFAGILADVDPAALDAVRTLVVYDEGEAVPALPLDRPVVRWRDLARDASPAIRGDADSGALVFTTSGTTRAPKFVLHAQRSLVAHARHVAPAFGYDAADAVLLQGLPLCGTFGHAQLMAALAGGRPSVLLPAFEAEAALAAIRAHRVTHFNGPDEMFHRLFDAAAPGDLKSLRACGFAGFNPALGDIVERGDEAGVALHGLYGMSEVQALFARQPADAPTAVRALAGGRPTAPDAAVRARDTDSGEILPPGRDGALEVRGPSLMAGYLDAPGETRAAMTDDGFFRTGDLGRTAADGGFVFVTRMGDALRLGGFLVNPAEIETHVEALPGVAACQVVGVETPAGPRAVAFVVPSPGAAPDAAAVMAHCRRGLAGFKVPAAVYAIDALPMAESPNGMKIQRARLRRMAEARLAGNKV